jgi:hypothetical protein
MSQDRLVVKMVRIPESRSTVAGRVFAIAFAASRDQRKGDLYERKDENQVRAGPVERIRDWADCEELVRLSIGGADANEQAWLKPLRMGMQNERAQLRKRRGFRPLWVGPARRDYPTPLVPMC